MAAKTESKFYAASTPLKYATTFVIYYGNVANAMIMATFGPTSSSFAAKFNTDVSKLNTVVPIGSAFFAISTLLAGVIFRRVDRQLGAILALAVEGIAVASLPHMPSVVTFHVAGSVAYFSAGFFNTAQTAWVIDIWRHKSGPYILAQHFFFSCGSVIAPLLLAPYLIDDEDDSVVTTASSTLSSSTPGADSADTDQLYIPFAAIGGLLGLAALVQLVLFVIYRSHKPTPAVTQDDEPERVQAKSWDRRKITLVALCCLFIGFDQAMEITSINYLSQFAQYSEVDLSASAAARVMSGLTFGYAGGRALGILVVLKVAPHLIIVANLVLIFTGNTILFVRGGSNVTYLWVGSICLGIGLSTAIPAFFAFIEPYILVDDFTASILLVSTGIMIVIFPLIVGNTVENTPKILNYCTYGVIVVAIVAFICLFRVTYWREKRKKHKRSDYEVK